MPDGIRFKGIGKIVKIIDVKDVLKSIKPKDGNLLPDTFKMKLPVNKLSGYKNMDSLKVWPGKPSINKFVPLKNKISFKGISALQSKVMKSTNLEAQSQNVEYQTLTDSLLKIQDQIIEQMENGKSDYNNSPPSFHSIHLNMLKKNAANLVLKGETVPDELVKAISEMEAEKESIELETAPPKIEIIDELLDLNLGTINISLEMAMKSALTVEKIIELADRVIPEDPNHEIISAIAFISLLLRKITVLDILNIQDYLVPLIGKDAIYDFSSSSKPDPKEVKSLYNALWTNPGDLLATLKDATDRISFYKSLKNIKPAPIKLRNSDKRNPEATPKYNGLQRAKVAFEMALTKATDLVTDAIKPLQDTLKILNKTPLNMSAMENSLIKTLDSFGLKSKNMQTESLVTDIVLAAFDIYQTIYTIPDQLAPNIDVQFRDKPASISGKKKGNLITIFVQNTGAEIIATVKEELLHLQQEIRMIQVPHLEVFSVASQRFISNVKKLMPVLPVDHPAAKKVLATINHTPQIPDYILKKNKEAFEIFATLYKNVPTFKRTLNSLYFASLNIKNANDNNIPFDIFASERDVFYIGEVIFLVDNDDNIELFQSSLTGMPGETASLQKALKLLGEIVDFHHLTRPEEIEVKFILNGNHSGLQNDILYHKIGDKLVIPQHEGFANKDFLESLSSLLISHESFNALANQLADEVENYVTKIFRIEPFERDQFITEVQGINHKLLKSLTAEMALNPRDTLFLLYKMSLLPEGPLKEKIGEYDIASKSVDKLIGHPDLLKIPVDVISQIGFFLADKKNVPLSVQDVEKIYNLNWPTIKALSKIISADFPYFLKLLGIN